MQILKIPQWIVWRLEENQDGKPTKIPYSYNGGGRASVTDSETWTTYENALDLWNSRIDPLTNEKVYNGIGFVFTDTDPFCCIDIDHINENMCEDIETILKDFDTYKEISQSGNGIHIIFKGKKKKARCRKKIIPWLECYEKDRWIAITGNVYENSPKQENDCQEQLDIILDKYFPQEEVKERTLPTIQCDLSNEDIIDIASKSSNGDKFQRLWKGDLYPGEDQSGADLALCNILAFYTQGNSQQIDSLFRMSGLYRKKWEREDYRRRTINYAIDGCSEFYTPQPKVDVSHIKVELSKIKAKMHEQNQDTQTDEEEDVSLSWTVPGVIEDFSDLGNAYYFYKNHSTDFIFNNENWYYWNGMKWETTSESTIRKAIQQIPSELKTVFETCINDTKLKKEALKWARQSGSSSHISGVVKECKTLFENNTIEFDAQPNLINCLDGVLDLKTLQLHPHNRNFYCSKIVDCKLSQEIPVNFLAFLARCLANDKDMELYLQKALGYCMTGENSEQTAYFLCGQGQTGKSTLVEIVGKILKEYNYNAPSGMFMDQNSGAGKFDLANLYGKRLCCTSELSSSKTLASEIFKKVTGGDTQDCDRKFKQPLRVRFIAKVLVATNDLPSFNPDYAISRRLKFIQFDKKVDTPDDSIKERLWAERDAIFSWLVTGANLYYKEGVGELETMKKFKEETIKNNNPMLSWFEENYDIIENNEGFTPRMTLWNKWNEYCINNHIVNPYKTIQGFVRGLNSAYTNDNRVAYKQITTGERGWTGIRVKY